MLDDSALDQAAITALIEGRHGDPFAILGPHDTKTGRVVRAFLPGARDVTITDQNGQPLGSLRQTHPSGLFEAALPAPPSYRLRIDWDGVSQETEDPYAFPSLLGDMDVYLLAEGRHWQIGACLGAQPMEVDGVRGVRFAVWAPNARRVSVIGGFNAWDGRRHPMRSRIECGVWDLFIPRLAVGAGTNTRFLALMA